ncbi:hypothetical protein GCM10022235_29890 [Kribbella ginsengisoli]|uniref:FAD-binding domain-containing protein n=2 Tax=Kribbella ginsengisoli TaxID=363865 RepID=A0ABP6X179_9ACTN
MRTKLSGWVENDQWLVMLMSYEHHPAAESIDSFRAACTDLPPIFAKASSGSATSEVQTYHQADSRRRDFIGLANFPARLIAVGDAVASFNPIYGQGLSSAALHASCLSEYLNSNPDLTTQATSYFTSLQVVVDAAWTISAGSDAARQDLLTGAEVPEPVQHQRWAMNQILQATLKDRSIAEAFVAVTRMQAHPNTLQDPALLERAVALNRPTP